jgi:predicted NBD/HSP70 family sugar kinase
LFTELTSSNGSAARAGRHSKATHQETKTYNSRLVLRTIYDHGQISRADVARRTGLSRTTVSELVAELLAQDLVEEIGFGLSNGGKTPILLQVRDASRSLIGVDLSRDEFRAELVNLRGETQHAVSQPLLGRRGKAAIDLVYELLDELVPRATSPVLGIGIGSPGLVDIERGNQVHWSVNLDWMDLPLRGLIESHYDVPCSVLNDCQASAIAEHFFGPDRNRSHNLVVIKSEQGLGSGLILNGQIFHGDNNGAGEIGHVVVQPDGLPCRCGNRGCLETLASVSGILERIAAQRPRIPRTAVYNPARRRQLLDIDEVRRALDNGDPLVRQVVHEAGAALGTAIANLVGALNVQRIVIAGGIVALGQELLNVIQEEVLRRSLTALARETEVVFSSLGSRITILGASAVFLQQELGLTPFR